MLSAMVAGAFAVDVAAKAKMELDVLNFNGNKVNMFKLTHGAESWNPSLAFNFGSDEAGAGFKLYDVQYNLYDGAGTVQDAEGKDISVLKVKKDGSSYLPASCGWNLWFSPLDGLKIKLGEMDFALNQEHIEWDHSNSKVGAYQGVGLSYASNGFSADVMLNMAGSNWGNYWLNGANDFPISNTAIKFAYGADFGTISADVVINAKDNILAGVGYAGNAAGWSFFANVIFNKIGDAFVLHPEVYVDGKAGDIGIQVFVPVTYAKGPFGYAGYYWNYRPACSGWGVDGGVLVGTTAKVSFPAGSLNGYVELKVGDWLSDKLSINIIPALTGSVGACGWEAKFDATIATKAENKFTFSVPVIFTINY